MRALPMPWQNNGGIDSRIALDRLGLSLSVVSLGGCEPPSFYLALEYL